MPDVRGAPPSFGERRGPRGGSRSWLWIIAGISAIAVVILLILFVFRKTSVTVIPQSQPVVFDQSAEFTAYPAASAVSGTLSYTVKSTDLEDSEVVPSNGTQHSESKASGSFTIVNNYSAAPVKLVKNTRFATASGLIFKVPAEVVVPGRGSSPGKVSITVIADKAGAAYNIGPTGHFTLPGLRPNAAMYKGVYAYSSASTTGGYSGDQPAVSADTLNAALGTIKKRLSEKAVAFADAQNTPDTLAPNLTNVSWVSLPTTAEADGKARVHLKANMWLPVVSRAALTAAIAQSVTSNAAGVTYTLIPRKDFLLTMIEPGGVGGVPIQLVPVGSAALVSNVDTVSLAKALAGRNSQAFQTIVSNFPGVQSAHARIEPFWESTFPAKPADIHITVETPKTTQ